MGTYANFYPSSDGDRVYGTDSFEEWLKPFFKTGIFNGEMQVTATGSSMAVNVAIGNAYIEGKLKNFETVTSLTISDADGSLNRIDNIVVQRNDTERDFIICVKEGSFASDPAAPEPVRENGVYEIVLAQIYVGAGATKITQSNITDTRSDDDLCGWVVSNIEEIDFDQLAEQFNTWQSEQKETFSEWVQTLHDLLDEETAGHLQNEIDEIKTLTKITIASTDWIEHENGYYYAYYKLSGVTGDMNYEIVGVAGSVDDTETTINMKSQLGRITYGETLSDGLMFFALESVPTIDLSFYIRRVN